MLGVADQLEEVRSGAQPAIHFPGLDFDMQLALV